MSAPAPRTRDVLPLWTGTAPGSEGLALERRITERSTQAFWPDRIVTGITRPEMTAFMPDRPNGAAVLVVPGGGYSRIVLDKEAGEMALWLNGLGVAAFVLEYRLPGEGHADRAAVPLQDAQRALRLLRAGAPAWGLDPARVGFLGCSAGGHMGALLATCPDRTVYAPRDAADALSARPDFEILLYPVISMADGLAHDGSRECLLGPAPSAEEKIRWSAERLVGPDVPPSFLVAARDDATVPVENTLHYAAALQHHGIAGELHVFDAGGHGFGIRDARQLPVSAWPRLAAAWLDSCGVLEGRGKGKASFS